MQQGRSGPLVTIIMPVYNAGGYLLPAVESILAQTYRNWELIVVDDGSTDDCLSTVDNLGDDRVVRVQQRNAGKPAAMNRALAMARGEFYAVQDADDLSHPLRIERQVECLLAHSQLAGVFTGHELIVDGRVVAPTFRAKSIEDCAKDIALGRMPAHDPTAMYRLSLVRSISYAEDLPIVEGHDYILRLGERFPLMVLAECLYRYRIHPSSVTKVNPARRNLLVQQVHERMCERRGKAHSRLLRRPAHSRPPSSEADNDLVSHFTASVSDQVAAGMRVAALRTGLASWRLNPRAPYYAKPLLYACIPKVLMRIYRAVKASRELRLLYVMSRERDAHGA